MLDDSVYVCCLMPIAAMKVGKFEEKTYLFTILKKKVIFLETHTSRLYSHAYKDCSGLLL